MCSTVCLVQLGYFCMWEERLFVESMASACRCVCSLSPCAFLSGVASEVKGAHLFLQRILYRINRLVLFWCAHASVLLREAKIWCRL